MCKGDKSCNCGCKDQYNLDLGTPLTFGDGGYISKKIVQDLDQRLLKQFPNDPQARAAMREQAMGVIRQMAYGGLTNKQSGSQKVDYNPDAAVSNNLYDQGLSVNEVDTSIMEGTTKEKLKDVGRKAAQGTIGIATGVIDAAGSMAGFDTEPLTKNLSNFKFGEMDKGDLERQKKANQIGQTVGATITTAAAGIATGGNPTVISRGADQAFQELGQIDPNSPTLNTIADVGQVGSQLYGSMASSGTTGGFSEEQLKQGTNYLNAEDTQALGNYLKQTQGVSQASGLQGLSLKYGGLVSYANGGPPANTSPNLTALAQANPDNNYFNDINLGPAGASSNAYVEDAIRFSYGPNGQTQFTVQTGQDKRGNSLYTTTDLSGLEKTVNSIEDENLRMAALGNMPGPLSYNKGYANLDLSPASKRSLSKESYFGDFGTEGNRQDIGSWEALMGRMNYLDVDPKTLKMQPISTVKVGPRSSKTPDCTPTFEGKMPASCKLKNSWANGGPISYALGGETDPPKRNTDPLKYQVAGIKPTRQDSLDLYNNSIQLDKFYKAAQAKLPLEPFIEFVFNDIADDPMDPMDYLKEVDRQDRYQPISKTLPFEHYVKTKGNLIGARDWLKGGDNEKDFPVAYIHPNINPQFQGDASVPVDPTDPLQGNIFAYQYRYIPLAIAPFDILSEEDKKKRIEQFGLSGVPKSHLNPSKLETPSRPTLELAVPTSNPTLKPQPRTQPIMRSDNSGNESSRGNRYGQYQIGERVWDDKRKQWVDNIWSKEEQSAKLAVDKPEPKEIIPPKFRYGGPVKYQGGGRLDYVEPKTVLRINTDKQGNAINAETQYASKTTALDPKRFFNVWDNSPMYRQMMQGKEQDLNVLSPDSNYNTYITAEYDKNRLGYLLSPNPFDYKEFTENNPPPKLKPGFEGLVEAAKERGATGKNITDFRNYNLQNLSFKTLPEYASNLSMAAMAPGRGDIMINSTLPENLVGPATVHELSHMQDMHIRDFNNPNNSIVSIGPRYGDDFRRIYRPEDFSNSYTLDSKISELGVPLMPRQDYKKIRDYSRANEGVMPESYGVSLPLSSSEGFTSEEEKDKIDFANYVTHPSETRARLNATRYEANKVAPNLWNPSYQHMTPEILNKLKRLIPEDKENLEFLNLRQLLQFYTDEQIIDMFNSISMNDDNTASTNIQTAKYGGPVKYQTGGPISYANGGDTDPPRRSIINRNVNIRPQTYYSVAESTGTQAPVFQSREDVEASGQKRFFNQTVQEADRVAAITGNKPNYKQAQETVTTGKQPTFVTNPDDPEYQKRAKAYRDKYGIEIDDPSVLERLANPMAQLEYYNRYGSFPNRAQMDLDPTYGNPFDIALGIYNPASYIQSGLDAADAASKGNYGEAALSSLGVIPGYYGYKLAGNLAGKYAPGAFKFLDKLEQGVDPSYAKDLIYSLRRNQIPTFKTATRWEPDEIPEFLKRASLNLTDEQKALKGSWYGYRPDGSHFGYFGNLGFYPATRKGPGNLYTLRLSNRQIANLEKSMPASAKGMSGKAAPIPSSNSYLQGELIIPEQLRKNAKAIRMDINPSEYGPSLYKNTLLEGLDPSYLTGKFLDEVVLDPVNNLYLTDKIKVPKKYIRKTGGPIDSANPEQTPTQPEKIVYIGAGITRAGSMEDPKGILDRENARAYYKALGYKDENIRFLEGAGQTKELENSILKAVRENPQGNIIIDAFSGAIGSAKRAWPKLTEEERKRVSEIIMAGGAYDGRWLASEDNFPGTKFTNRPDIKGHYAHYEQYLKKLQESQPKVEEPKPQLWSPPSPQVTNPANIYQGYPAEPVSTYVAPPVLPGNRVQLNPPDFRYGGGLRRWFKEEWTDVKTGEPCGRESTSDSSRPYPYCRPANKVSSKTPATTKHPEAKKRARSKTGPTRVKPITR